MGMEQKKKGCMVKSGETLLEAEKHIKLVILSLCDGPMESVEYMWVNIWCMLNWIIGLCHKATKIHFFGIICSTSECTK